MNYSELTEMLKALGIFFTGLGALITSLKNKKEPKQNRRPRRFK